MKNRNIGKVVAYILEDVPETEERLIFRLGKLIADLPYTAPEQIYMRWGQLSEIFADEIGHPSKDWHWKVASTLSTKSIEELKKTIVKK